MTYGIFTGHDSVFYETTDQVAETVNLAIKLRRPILVEGEAGCGKTQLAYAIAAELKLGAPVALRIKSTTQAKDLLYRFDALRRLQEVQNPNFAERAQFVHPYVSLQRLGLAIKDAEQCVVLIDEIDKADIDFPNDLLDVLDEFAFDIDDLPDEEEELCCKARGFGRRIGGSDAVRPIVVITSNREKQLPEPFLRRCLYLELVFPREPELLARIVAKNFCDEASTLADDLVAAAVAKFIEVREQAREAGADQKLPATSELIDWIRILHWRAQPAASISDGGLRPPYYSLLFKTANDRRKYEARLRE
jgi:MoxR-like ATPase